MGKGGYIEDALVEQPAISFFAALGWVSPVGWAVPTKKYRLTFRRKVFSCKTGRGRCNNLTMLIYRLKKRCWVTFLYPTYPAVNYFSTL